MRKLKITKLTAWLLIGAILLCGGAFADALVSNGYNNAKDSIKRSCDYYSKNGNFTSKASISFTGDNENSQKHETELKKSVDTIQEEETIIINGVTTNYSYSNKNYMITKNENDEKYYKSIFADERGKEDISLENPFEDKWADDFEKIFDTFVGNLDQFVQESEKTKDGRKYSMSLDGTQIPPLANAITSFIVKYSSDADYGNDVKLFKMTDGIYIKNITGELTENSDKIITSGKANILICGFDKNNELHSFEINASLEISDIGKTVINEPEIDEDNIEVVQEIEGKTSGFDEKLLGKYSCDVVTLNESSYVKTGEISIELLKNENNNIMGEFTINGKTESIIAVKKNYDEYLFTFTKDNEKCFGIISQTFNDYASAPTLDVYLDIDVNDPDDSELSWSVKTENEKCHYLFVKEL